MGVINGASRLTDLSDLPDTSGVLYVIYVHDWRLVPGKLVNETTY